MIDIYTFMFRENPLEEPNEENPIIATDKCNRKFGTMSFEGIYVNDTYCTQTLYNPNGDKILHTICLSEIKRIVLFNNKHYNKFEVMIINDKSTHYEWSLMNEKMENYFSMFADEIFKEDVQKVLSLLETNLQNK